MKTHNEVEQRRSMADIPMIGDMSITDEHKLVPLKTKMKKILDILRNEPSTAVILADGKGKKMKVAGVITAEDIDKAVDAGKNPKKLSVVDVMLTNILEVPNDVPIDRAIEVIAQKGPDAVIVRHKKDGGFAGYFSVEDYQEAKGIIESQQQRAQDFQKNTEGFGGRAQALQNQLEDDGDDDDDDDDYIPAGMKGLPISPQMKSVFKSTARSKPDASRAPAAKVDLSNDPNRVSVAPPSGPEREEQGASGPSQSGGPPSRGPPGKRAGPPSRGPPGRKKPEPEPQEMKGPARPAGPSLPGGGPPPRSAGGVTNVATEGSNMADIGGHLLIESTGAATGPGPTGTTARTANERICPFCGESIKVAAKKCRFCMEWLDN